MVGTTMHLKGATTVTWTSPLRAEVYLNEAFLPDADMPIPSRLVLHTGVKYFYTTYETRYSFTYYQYLKAVIPHRMFTNEYTAELGVEFNYCDELSEKIDLSKPFMFIAQKQKEGTTLPQAKVPLK